MTRRLPLQEGFERLLPHYTPAVAGEMIEAAWRENRLRLYCNGKLLAPGYIKSELQLLVEYEADGRPQCCIRPAGPLGWESVQGPSRPGEKTDYSWEVDAEGVEALVPPTSTLKSTRRQTWRTGAEAEILHLRRIHSPLLKNFRRLCEHISAHVTEQGHPPTKNTHRFHTEIARLLKVHVK